MLLFINAKIKIKMGMIFACGFIFSKNFFLKNFYFFNFNKFQGGGCSDHHLLRAVSLKRCQKVLHKWRQQLLQLDPSDTVLREAGRE